MDNARDGADQKKENEDDVDIVRAIDRDAPGEHERYQRLLENETPVIGLDLKIYLNKENPDGCPRSRVQLDCQIPGQHFAAIMAGLTLVFENILQKIADDVQEAGEQAGSKPTGNPN